MTSQAQQDLSLRELWSRVVRYLRANLRRSLLMSALSFVGGWLLNIYVMAVRYEGSVVAPGAAATSPGNAVQGGMYWGILSTVVFSLVAYGHQAGWGKLRDDLLSLPTVFRHTFAAPAAGAWSMLLWGAAVSLIAGAVIGPAVAGILGAGLLLLAPSPISSILGRLISRLWIGVLSVVSPPNKQRVGGMGGTIASVAGTALGMFLAWRTGDDLTKGVLAVVAAVVAFLIATRKATPQGVATVLLIAGGLLALRRIFEGVAFADDGGWTECGDCSIADWARSPGADEVIRSGLTGGAASGVGAALGTGLGGAVADLGASGGDIPPRPGEKPPGGDDLPDRPGELPPLRDEHGEVMEVSDGTQVDADGNPIPPGLVRWDVGEDTRWVSRDDAIDLVQETRDAAATRAQFDREVAAGADELEAESRERVAAERAQAEVEAQERIRERESLERWGERLEGRDALVRRQELLEADSTRKNTDEGWWDMAYDEYQRGVQQDVSDLRRELGPLINSALSRVAEEVSDGENWRVLGETVRDTTIDAARVVAGDREKTQEVADNLRAGLGKTAEIAGALVAAARREGLGGSVVAVARAVLGAENWEQVFDRSVPVGERFGRAVWGVIDTGGILLAGGTAAVGAIDKVGDFVRGADAATDALRVADATGDALRAVDAAGDAARAADTAGDAARTADAAGDALRATDATGDAVRGADAAGDAARAGDTAGDVARTTRLTPEERLALQRREDALRARRGTAGRQPQTGPKQPRTPYQDPAATQAALDDLRRPISEFGDETAQAAERARRRQQIFDSKAPGTTPDDYIANLPEGAIIDQNLVHHAGYTGEQLDGLRTVAREQNVVSGTRLTNAESMRHVRDGTGLPKPVDIKPKTIGELDTYLGADPADRGLVGLFDPKRTPDEAFAAAQRSIEGTTGKALQETMSPEDIVKLREAIEDRHAMRAAEYVKELDGVKAGGFAVDVERGVVTRADGVPFAGDIDPVFFRDATTGDYLSGDRYLEVRDAFMRSSAQGQHGAEINLLGDVTRGLEPGSAEWHEAYNKALELHKKLGASHTSGAEVVVEVGPDGILRRGTDMGGGLPDVENVASRIKGMTP